MGDKRTVVLETRALSMMIRRYMDSQCMALQEMKRLTGMHGMILGFLYRNRDVNVYQRDLEKEFDFKRSTATKILQLLESKGYIIREGDDGDKRMKRILLTNEALEMNRRICSELSAAEERIEGLLTDEERQAFFNIVSKLKSGLECPEGGN